MRIITRTLFVLLFAATSAIAGLPSQDDVFTIVSFTPYATTYVSADYIFSALPFYEEVGDPDSISDYPSHKRADTQQGAIVLCDKTVLFFDLRSPKYLSVVDPSNHSTFYRLAKAPLTHRKCQKPPKDIDALPFPMPEDVFCIATFPWNQGRHFTPQSLAEALPRFRPLSERDVPAIANVDYMKHVYPKEWYEAQHGKHPEALSGVIVLNNRRVLKWITWTPHAIAFQNYQQNTYFVIDQ